MNTTQLLLNEQQEIKNVIEKYTLAVNTRNWPLYKSCWSDQGTWELEEPLPGKYDGIAAVMEHVVEAVTRWEFFIQMTHAIVVTEITSTTARAAVTLNEICRKQAGSNAPFPAVFTLAMYFDDMVKDEGQWKFSKRLYKVAYWDTGPLAGEAFQQKWVL